MPSRRAVKMSDHTSTSGPDMFSIFKSNPADKLKKQHSQLLEKAMLAQRNGDIRTYSSLTNQAESVLKDLDALEGKPK